MKRFLTKVWLAGFLLAIPVWVMAQVAPEDVDTNAELFDLLGQLVESSKSGNGALTIALALTVLIAILRNSGKIPALKLLKINVLVAKIPKRWFPTVVLGLGAILGVVGGLAAGASLLTALKAGLTSALMATGLHQAAKGPLSALGLLSDSDGKKKKK